MARYAAFLRAINVTGRRVTGPDLCAPLEGLGLTEVRTFRASGNVIFEGAGETPARLAGRIGKALEQALGYEVVTFVRTARQVRDIAAQEPFDEAALAAAKGKLQVSLLSGKPSAKVRREVLALDTGTDRLAFGEQELFWLPSRGTQDSSLDMKSIERAVGPSTMRTMGTIEQIAAKHFAA